MYQQKLSSWWWTANLRTVVYFLRELTGFFIALYCIYFLVSALFDPAMTFTSYTAFHIMSGIGLTAAIFHTLTWLWVSVKISPVPLGKLASIVAFFLLLAAWIGVSYFLLMNFYVTK